MADGTLLPHCETLAGRVVRISDGDTITVLVERPQIKVRLADIDAPESKQPFGSRSKQALSDLCYRKDARREAQGRDRYGRTIATVYCTGRNANAEQVWHRLLAT
jgi:endonuclease YncB( thermonuclease family)